MPVKFAAPAPRRRVRDTAGPQEIPVSDTTAARPQAPRSQTGARSETMRAVVCHGPEDYRLETVPVPVRRPGELLVQVEAVGICASDLKCYHGATKFWGDGERAAWAETEVVPGHEFVGTVVELDDEARTHWGVEVFLVGFPLADWLRPGGGPSGSGPRVSGLRFVDGQQGPPALGVDDAVGRQSASRLESVDRLHRPRVVASGDRRSKPAGPRRPGRAIPGCISAPEIGDQCLHGRRGVRRGAHRGVARARRGPEAAVVAGPVQVLGRHGP